MARKSSTDSVEKSHIRALDGVRGLAILAVLGSHLLLSNNLSSSVIIQGLLDIRDLLWTGVTLFFALSGYLITGILFDTRGTEGYFRTFFGRRALRIFPLYYGVVLGLLLMTKPLHLNWHGEAWKLLTYCTDLPFTRQLAGDPSPYIGLNHFWSLAVEEQFYLIWPFVIFWLRDWSKVLWATLAGVGLSLAFRTAIALRGLAPQNHTLFGCMDALLLGGALALLMRSAYGRVAVRWGAPVFVISAALTLERAFTQPNFDWWSSTYLTTVGMTVISLGMVGLIAASLRPGSLTERVCSSGFLRFFGRYSYGLYVYHYSVDASLTRPLRGLLEARGWTNATAIAAVALVALGISVAIAMASYHLYEKHFLKLKRYIPNKRAVFEQETEPITVSAS